MYVLITNKLARLNIYVILNIALSRLAGVPMSVLAPLTISNTH